METITKAVNEVQVGDVVQYDCAFELTYTRVTATPEMDTNGSDSWFVIVGEEPETGDPSELYIAPGDTVEVVASAGTPPYTIKSGSDSMPYPHVLDSTGRMVYWITCDYPSPYQTCEAWIARQEGRTEPSDA